MATAAAPNGLKMTTVPILLVVGVCTPVPADQPAGGYSPPPGTAGAFGSLTTSGMVASHVAVTARPITTTSSSDRRAAETGTDSYRLAHARTQRALDGS